MCYSQARSTALWLWRRKRRPHGTDGGRRVRRRIRVRLSDHQRRRIWLLHEQLADEPSSMPRATTAVPTVCECQRTRTSTRGRVCHVAVRRTAWSQADKPVESINRKNRQPCRNSTRLCAILFLSHARCKPRESVRGRPCLRQEKLFLVSIMMGQQPESHSCTFEIFLNVVSWYSRIRQSPSRPSARPPSSWPYDPKNMIKKQRCLVAQPTDAIQIPLSSTEKYASCERRSYTVQKRIAPFFHTAVGSGIHSFPEETDRRHTSAPMTSATPIPIAYGRAILYMTS